MCNSENENRKQIRLEFLKVSYILRPVMHNQRELEKIDELKL
jgi:hypothetical protein